jgi:hypothetical protein
LEGKEVADDPLKVMFVAGFGPIVKNPSESAGFYRDALRLPLEAMPGDETYLHTGDIDGVRHFALWPLASAAESCFGTTEWPASVPEPTSWMEFDVEDVGAASAELERRGCRRLVNNREEPWGQTVTRLLSPEGILVGITFTPRMR